MADGAVVVAIAVAELACGVAILNRFAWKLDP
jgi:hypothetical protein